MNAAHIHLIFNHFPFISLLIGIGILLYGMLAKRYPAVQIGLMVIVFAWLTAIPTFASGEGAEEIVEKLPEVSHKIVHEHEESAERAIIFVHLTGILALASLYLSYRQYAKIRIVYWIALVFSCITLVMLAQVSQTGGKIRHPEIRE
ncbi:MAG: hypothetical protein NZ551_01525 [Microscillaceae bacterium]|nr:hypothetical protein [Microscillaceae bacterium]MDW8459868.1 hypothetical protein [Cytophagales bacterium]